MANFVGGLLSSLILLATFGLCILIVIPRNCFKKYMCFFNKVFLPAGFSVCVKLVMLIEERLMLF